jgi:hypothetical protein
MNELNSKIKLMTEMYLKDEDFVVKPLIETETELKFIIVSSIENIEKLTLIKNKVSEESFLNQMLILLNLMKQDLKITKKIVIETETLDGGTR